MVIPFHMTLEDERRVEKHMERYSNEDRAAQFNAFVDLAIAMVNRRGVRSGNHGRQRIRYEGRRSSREGERQRKSEQIMRSVLKKAREDKGMTQKQVADYLGIGERYYKALEYGERLGGIECWDRLEDLFKIHQRVLREDSGRRCDREDSRQKH